MPSYGNPPALNSPCCCIASAYPCEAAKQSVDRACRGSGLYFSQLNGNGLLPPSRSKFRAKVAKITLVATLLPKCTTILPQQPARPTAKTHFGRGGGRPPNGTITTVETFPIAVQYILNQILSNS